MSTASFRFYHELEELLAPGLRGGLVVRSFVGSPSVKHMVESLQIPHTEIGRVLLDRQPADPTALLHGGELVEIYPPGDEAVEQLLKDHRPPAFLLDGHLGKLATYLRMLGMDVRYSPEADDAYLAMTASREGLPLLTRDRRLLMRKIITTGYLVRSLDPLRQLREVANRFRLDWRSSAFTRCLRCNSCLQPTPKRVVFDRLEPLTKQYYDEFSICPQCGRIYWKGSHYEHMKAIIQQIQGENP